ncbi:pyruvate formate-lyase-activating protein [Clostridium oceanicum]|uniref:Pyruvate formate-lyase-activating enzyme n=1 Tax=Clostridium oceanicum TaxID=1543 RepID=A0ABP3V951_9CLOT
MGKIHSIETLGLVDGPGIRFVVFFQGCTLRCLYCHNPDTWDLKGGEEIEAEDLIKKVKRYKPYFKNNGGVTCSGGEPLMQPEFLLRFFKLCKENNLNTVLDTAGVGLGNYEEILKYTDLVMLDIKHIDDKNYFNICGRDMKEFIKFKNAVNKLNKKLWIRHVVVPGVTDDEKHIGKLRDYIKTFNNVEKVELLPYHTLGVNKYKEMKIPYKLQDVDSLDKNKLKKLNNILKQ